MSVKQTKRARIHKRIRARVIGTKDVPRLCVFKSAQHIYAQLIDDENGKVLVSASDITLKSKKGKKVEQSMEVGKFIAKEASAKKIEKVVFDRGGFLFHGRIKAVAEGAREGGLKF
jgi:large subunit ribosomal protein L18